MDGELWHQRAILAQIVNVDSRLGISDFDRREHLRHFDRWRTAAKAEKCAARPFGFNRRGPLGIAVAGSIPAGLLQAGVIILAAKCVGKYDWADGGSPAPIGNDALSSAVGVSNIQLGDDFRLAEVAGEFC